MLTLQKRFYIGCGGLNSRKDFVTTVQDQTKGVAISIDQAAELAGCSAALLYVLARRSKLPGCRRLGKRFVVHRETFLKWLGSGRGDERADEAQK
jgi:excisionase family DNA binding protein